MPPPFGGISVYVDRLAHALADAGHRVHVFDISDGDLIPVRGIHVVNIPPQRGRFWSIGARIAAMGADVAHLHMIGLPSDQLAPIVLSCRAFGVPVVISVHSLEPPEVPESRAGQRLLALTAPHVAAAFASGAHVATGLVPLGVPAARISAVPPFLPPAKVDPQRLPAEVRALRARMPKLVVAGASALQPFAGGDLYGVDTFLAMAQILGQRDPDVGFVLHLSRRGDPALAAAMDQTLAELGLGDRFLLLQARLEEASDLWALADVYVRPTRTDGDSVSVHEALALGIPTLASDAVQRPAAAALFAHGDAADAVRVVAALLADLPAARAHVRAHRPIDGGAAVQQTLERVAAPRSRWRSLARRASTRMSRTRSAETLP